MIRNWPEIRHQFLKNFRRAKNPDLGVNTAWIVTMIYLQIRWIQTDDPEVLRTIVVMLGVLWASKIIWGRIEKQDLKWKEDTDD